MGWTWRYADGEGSTISAADGAQSPGSSSGASGAASPDGELPSPSFPTQADAESWIGETWQELFAGGVEAVFLLEDDTVVYGPMSLRPPA